MRRVLVVGGGFAGLAVGRDLATHFLVTIVDCKEFFEYTPGILRCYVKPKHFDALSFNLQPVIEERMGCKFIWGEVKSLNANRTAVIKPMFSPTEELIDFDYCVICGGCNFGPNEATKGESLWFPTVHEIGRSVSEWKQFDERFIEGRRRHIFDEWDTLKRLQKEKESIMITGAGFIGVEWITEIAHFFNGMPMAIMDMLPQALGPLPDNAAKYCQAYMTKVGILQAYSIKKDAQGDYFKVNWSDGIDPNTKKFDRNKQYPLGDAAVKWEEIPCVSKGSTGETFGKKGFKQPIHNGTKFTSGKDYNCIGVKASNYFMNHEPACLSKMGPGGGKWLYMDKTLSCVKYTGEEKINMYNVSAFSKQHAADLIGVWQKNGDTWSNGKLTMKLETKPGADGTVVKDKKGKDAKFLVIACKPDEEGVVIKLYSKPQQENGAPFHSGDNDFTYTDSNKKTFKAVAKGHEHFCEDDDGYSRVYAIGDCNYGCYEGDGPPATWALPFIPKISYPGEEEGIVACRNIESTDALLFGEKENCWGTPVRMAEMHWPWGAGMFATSLGPNDACFVVSANWNKGSGIKVLWGSMSAVQKEVIEHSKVDECGFGFLGRAIWHFVHHTPVHLWGGGPRWGY